jgi:DNA-binding GntR family transcriptional regulator
VYQHVKGRILDASLAPGDRIVIDQLAKELGVSLTPVRETLRLLEKDGLVQHEPHKGAVVRRVTKDDYLEMFAVRERLEMLAAGMAAKRIGEGAVTIEPLRFVLDKARQAFASGEQSPWIEADRSFHATICELAGNHTLAEMLRVLSDRFLAFLRTTTPRQMDGRDAALDQHARICEAIERGDAAAAEQLMQEHIRWSLERAIERQSI